MLIFGGKLIHRSLYLLAGVNFTLASLLVVFIIIIRKAANAKIIYRIVVALLSLLLLYWVNRGAIKGYASIWIMVIPPFAFFLMGRKEGLVWTLALSLLTAIQFIFPSLSFYGYTYDPAYVSRHLFSLFMIILFTYNYELMRERYKTGIESEKARLKEEMIIRRKAEDELRAHKERLEELVAERTLELQQSNASLAANEARYRIIADNITDMIWSADLNLSFTFISPSVTRIFGYTVEEALDMPFNKWNTDESFRKVIEVFTEQIEIEKSGKGDPDRYVTIELQHIRKDGNTIPVEVTVSFLRDADGKPAGILGITRDISERVQAAEENRRIQEQLSQAQKMEAIGTLVSGIAHDFNNILGGIIGSYDLLARLLKDENIIKKEKIDKYLNFGMESSIRSAELIKQLLALSRKHELTLSPVDISNSLGHVVEICRNSLPKTVEIDYLPSDIPLAVMGDTVQIEQVFLNLCINASHAMTIMRPENEKQGGVLKIRSSVIQSEKLIRELCPDAVNSAGKWIRVEISDTGVGIDDDTSKRIFEPFFSMKQQHDGSGLGLAISYNIIRQHRGMIHLYSEPGKGSCFSVYVPACDNNSETVRFVKEHGEIEKGNGRILVIDDEHVMLNVARGFLEESGYTVVTADSGDEGISIYRTGFRDFAAVLVDLSMPGKSGIAVALELRSINSEAKIILASGMLDSEARLSAESAGIMRTINKPYLADELSRMLKSVLS